MLLVPTRISMSETHGIGLFAAAPISSGTKMWEYSPFVDRLYSEDELSLMPSAAVGLFHKYGQYTDSGALLICGDDARFANHCDVPSMSNMGWFAIAARDIAEGEEITEDYRTFAPGACRAFLD
jgi:uncharacterized protein